MYTPCLNRDRVGWGVGWFTGFQFAPWWIVRCSWSYFLWRCYIEDLIQYTQPPKKRKNKQKTTRKITTISTLLMSSHSMHNAVALLLCQLPLAIPICWIGFNVQREHMMKIHVSKHIKYHIFNLNTANTPTKRHEWPQHELPHIMNHIPSKEKHLLLRFFESVVVRQQLAQVLLSSSQITTAFGIIQAVLSSPWQHPGFLME